MQEIKGNGMRSVKGNRKLRGKLLAGALVLCLAAGVAPLDVQAEETLSISAEGEASAAVRAAGEVQTGSVDGIVEGSVTWTYDPTTGEVVVTGSGRREVEDSFLISFSSLPEETKSLRFENCVISGSCRGLFYYLSNLETINFSGLDTGNVTDMSYMFEGCSSLESLDISGLNTSNVTNMSSMFVSSGLKSLDLSGLDVGNVTDMRWMFEDCSSLESLDISGLDTGNVTDMSDMFSDCSSLVSLDVSGLDTGNVVNMSHMFYGCRSLKSLDVSGLNTSNVTDMSSMFSCCDSVVSLDISGFDTDNVTDMNGMFFGCSSLVNLDLSGLDTGNVTNMGSMFDGCRSVVKLDVSGFDTRNVTNMSNMFSGCRSVVSLDVSGFNTGNVINMGYMFCVCNSLTSLDISGFAIGNVTNMGWMLSGCSSLISLTAPKSLETKEIALPGTFVDQEGNRTDVLNDNFSGKLLTREDAVSEPGHCVSGTIKLSGDTTATVELIDAQGTVTATQTVTGSTAEYRLENVPAGTYTLLVSQANGVVREYTIAVTNTDVSQDTEVQLLGDVNGDGTINARDKKLIFNHIEKISVLSGYLFDVGDVNRDGTINARDKKILYNHIERIALLW